MKLSNQERKIYERLHKSGGGDVSIHVLHDAVYDPIDDVRRMQQRIGPIISRVNEKLKNSSRKSENGKKIQPGVARQTYALAKVKRES